MATLGPPALCRSLCDGFGAASESVTLIQRFGSAANLNIHLHCLVLDGVYRCGADGAPGFIEAGAPTDDTLHELLHTIIARLMKLLTRRGVLVEDGVRPTWPSPIPTTRSRARCGRCRPRPSAGTNSPPDCLCPSSAYRIAFGPRAGIEGFSLHAAVRVEAHDR